MAIENMGISIIIEVS